MEQPLWTDDISNSVVQKDVIEVAPASAGRRIAAYLLNTVLTMIVYIVVIFSMLAILGNGEDNSLSVWGVLLSFIILIAYGVWQVWWMSRDGQSIGKKIMGIKVLKLDGTNPGFIGVVLVREVAFNLLMVLAGALLGLLLVVFVGGGEDTFSNSLYFAQGVVSLVCLVMLFMPSRDRRTLQDVLAGTIVVRLPPKPAS